jgi:hypothetical protein
MVVVNIALTRFAMDLELLLETLNRTLVTRQTQPLSPVETILLRGIWLQQTYSQIAGEAGYSAAYLTNVVAPELWHRLSELIGQRLTKKNCRAGLEAFVKNQTILYPSSLRSLRSTLADVTHTSVPTFPSGAIAQNSPFYITRPPIEEQVYQEIQKPGALVRVKAPREMGKTSLLLQTLNDTQQQGYAVIYLSLEQADQAIYTSPNRFLRWLCANMTHQLQLEPKLDDYWDEDIGSKVSCSLYIRNYLLEHLNVPLVLVLDEVNQVFEHPEIAADFLPLLRSWYEDAKRLAVWQKLRLIIAHSTEIYVPLKLNQSPFNVGLATQLVRFNLEQVKQLAQRYGLDWSDGKAAQQLMALVGGHPALIHLAIYHLSCQDLTLEQVLTTAAKSTGIYHHHLQRHWVALQGQTALVSALYSLIGTEEPMHLELSLAYKLNSMGLIHLSGNEVTISCELYRQYFKEVLQSEFQSFMR